MTNTNFKKMKRTIMLRVYYTFALRVLRSPFTLHVAVLVAAVYGVGHFVHVASVMKNLANVPLGDVAPWLMSAASNTEGITLLVLGVSILALLSLPIQFPQYRQSLQMHNA